MSEQSLSSAQDAPPLFTTRAIALILAIGSLAFGAAVVLAALTPDLRRLGTSEQNALSRSSIGLAGIVQLASATGRNPRIIRDANGWEESGLVVAVPGKASVPIHELLTARYRMPTLVVLPKWNVEPDPDRSGWVTVKSLLPVGEPEGVFAPARKLTITRRQDQPGKLRAAADFPASIVFDAPDKLQVITDYRVRPQGDEDDETDGGDRTVSPANPEPAPTTSASPRKVMKIVPTRRDDEPLEPLITDGKGGVVLARIDQLYILSDPDLIDNGGLANRDNAAAALAMLDWMNRNERGRMGFDISLNGLGGGQSLLGLAVKPPFVAFTLALLALALLFGWLAFARFGPAKTGGRAIAMGKAALVENSAALIRRAGRTREFGRRYAEVVREQAVRGFSLLAKLNRESADDYLDTLDRQDRFSDLALRAEQATTETDMLAAARALHQWQQENSRDDR